jgi:hypothetical protein
MFLLPEVIVGPASGLVEHDKICTIRIRREKYWMNTIHIRIRRGKSDKYYLHCTVLFGIKVEPSGNTRCRSLKLQISAEQHSGIIYTLHCTALLTGTDRARL